MSAAKTSVRRIWSALGPGLITTPPKASPGQLPLSGTCHSICRSISNSPGPATLWISSSGLMLQSRKVARPFRPSPG
jgi:hypothetical protein